MSIVRALPRFGGAFLCILAAACGGGGGGKASGGGDLARPWPVVGTPAHTPDGGFDLGGVAPAATEAAPLGKLEINGLPDDADIADLHVEFYVKEGEAPMEGLIDAFRLLPVFEMDNRFFLAMPLLDTEGATIAWRMTDGASTSEVFETRIEALPAPRTGSVDTLLEGAEAMLREATEALGRSYPDEWEYWRDHPDQIPVYLIPLWQSWHGMFDRQNDLAWVNQTMSDDVRLTLERILAAQPMDDLLFDMAAWIADGHSLLNDASGLLPVRTNSGVSPKSYMTAIPGEEPDRTVRQPGLMPITHALELAAELEQYDQARRTLRNMEIFDETVMSYITAVGTLAALPVAAGTGGGAAVAINTARRQLTARIANIALMLSRVNQMAKFTSPCCITSLDVTLDPVSGRVTEDMPESQIWLTDARVRAESEPVNITQEIGDAIIAESSKLLSGAISSAVAGQYSAAIQESKIAEDASSAIVDYAASGVAKQLLSPFPVDADMVFFWDNIDLMYGEPQKWLDVEAVSLSGSVDQSIVEQTPTGQHEMAFHLRTPEAFHLQSSLLRFNTRPEALPAVAPAITTKSITLDYLELEFNPSVLRVDDAPVDFSLTLKNASSLSTGPGIDYIDVAAFLDGFTVGTATYHGRNGAVMHFTYTPPEDGFPEDHVMEVETGVNLETGIRAPSHSPPPRPGALLVTGEGEIHNLTISPLFNCMQGGEQQQFTATGLGGEPVSVDWRVEGPGQINAAGLYTAGQANGDGQAVVTATLQADDAITAVAHITLGDCSCWWAGQVGGDFQQQAAGDTQWIEQDEQNRIVKMSHVNDDNVMFHLDLSEDPIAPGATGTYQATVNGTFDRVPQFGSFWGNPASPVALTDGLPPIPKLQVQVSQHDMLPHPHDDGARMLEARVTGTVVYEWLEYSPNRIERLSGNLDVGIKGSYWIGLGPGTLNCSRGL